MQRYLQAGNRKYLALVAFANILVFLWATGGVFVGTPPLSTPWTLVEFEKVVSTALPVAGIAVLGLGSAMIINHVVDPVAKARTIFWKWRNPLPGSEAFTRLAKTDPRIDQDKLAAMVGEFPAEAHKQNSVWYSLYKMISDDPSVAADHQPYLLARDCAVFCFGCLLLFAPAAFYQLGITMTSALYALGLLAQYLLVRQAAANAGRRLVTTVLAIAAAKGCP